MEFVKERNFISAYDSNGEKLCSWNITTGEMIGKSGKVVKNRPYGMRASDLDYKSVYGKAIKEFFEWKQWYKNDKYTSNIGNKYEQFISIGLNIKIDCLNKINIKPDKNFVDYINTYHPYCSYIDFVIVREYEVFTKYKDFLQDKPQWVTDTIKRLQTTELPCDYVKKIMDRIIKEHVLQIMSNYWKIVEVIENYYKISMILYNEVKVVPNILTAYANLKYLYEEYKTHNYDTLLKMHNDKSFLYYETEKIKAFPLITRESFHDEATQQHNCVENTYMEKVANNETYIIAIRRKDNMEKSYITCEVSKDGEIKQFLAKYNQVPDEDIEARKFYTLYTSHIMKAFSKNSL